MADTGADDYVYDEVSGEWVSGANLAVSTPESEGVEVRDSVGNLLADGDQVTLIKDLTVKGAGQTLKRGTLIKSIRLTGDSQEIDCRYDGIKGLVLRAEFVKKWSSTRWGIIWSLPAFKTGNATEPVMTQSKPKTLSDIAETMRDIDFCMLNTHTDTGGIAARPMSNNREVDYDGDSWFFTHESALMVPEIEADPAVGLSYQGKAGFLGSRPLFIAVDGTADLIRDKSQFEAHWTKDLDKWFEQGVDTPGLVMICVHAGRIHYWDGEDEGTVRMRGR